MGILQVRILEQVFPSPGSLRDPGIESVPLTSLASAGGFFTLAPWEAPGYSPEGFKEWTPPSACACIWTNTHTHTYTHTHTPSAFL